MDTTRRSSEQLNGDAAKATLLPCWRRKLLIRIDPEILGGTPAFTGTRVPIKSLFDHLEAGDSIDDFLEGFPSVSRDQLIALLEMSQERTS